MDYLYFFSYNIVGKSCTLKFHWNYLCCNIINLNYSSLKSSSASRRTVAQPISGQEWQIGLMRYRISLQYRLSVSTVESVLVTLLSFVDHQTPAATRQKVPSAALAALVHCHPRGHLVSRLGIPVAVQIAVFW